MEKMDIDSTDEDYVIQRAKSALKTDPYSAKAWMITAKTLYPNNFGVQFEAYCIEKNAGHVKEAAKCFSDLIGKFQQQPELWKEIENVTSALRAESDTSDPEKQFLCEMFKHISSDVQHKLLLCTADRCEDTMEHCKLLLLLLQRFPTAIASYGSRLVDTLLTAEKHSHDCNHPLNPYRKLLICELLPLLSNNGNPKVELSSHVLQKLIYKSIEFYSYYLGTLQGNFLVDNESKIDDPWRKLFSIIEFIGKQLKWDSTLINFNNNWNKETYWQRILTYCQSKRNNLDDNQLLICSSIYFLNCLHDYSMSLTPESSPGQQQTVYILIEAFVDSSHPPPASEPKSKKRKDDFLFPHISVERPELKSISSNFLMAVNCWDLIQSTEYLQREFITLTGHLKVEPWLTNFIIDYAVYKGKYDEALVYLQKINDSNQLLNKYILIACILYIKKNFSSCFEHILQAIPLLPNNNYGTLSNNLIIGGNQRHLHYLPLTHLNIVQYFVKLLLRCIKENMLKHNYNELSIGHLLVLVQLDWPQEEEFVPPLMEQIQHHGSFNYLLFQNYIINVDILEEITYLWTNQGGQITLDIIPHMGQRRIGTRGADKGAKEEIKQIIKRQVARSNENINELLIRFITHERTLILQSLM